MSEAIVTFGEIMGRLCPDGFLRFRQVLPGSLDWTWGGAESNVAGDIAMLGRKTRFVTALPDHVLADACISFLQGLGIDTSYIVRSETGRLGLYFLETGANQRPGNVLYDRDGSTAALTPGSAYDWKAIFADACWFHISGITPALSATAAAATETAVQAAAEAKVKISCDLNFRKKLWRWKPGCASNELAGQTMRRILPYVQVVIANEEDAEEVLNIRAGASDVRTGHLEIERYPEVAKQIIEQFPQVEQVAITLRESISASYNNWGAMLYDRESDRAFFAPQGKDSYEPYPIRNIVDRVGCGDSFAAGLIYALNEDALRVPAKAIAFAVATSCLAHSIQGDINYVNRKEVEALMGGSASGRVVR